MSKQNWFKHIKFNIPTPSTTFSLFLLILTQLPVAIKNTAEIACIGQTSNKIWKTERNHSEANMLAVQRCNGAK